MAKVILHIGTHKTATTTIQDTFHANTDLLAAHGVIYPRYNRITGHHGLVHDWGSLPDVYRLPGGSRATLTRLVNEYAHRDVTVVLSSEEFSRAAPDARVDFTELRELLSGFDAVEVVCTLRIQWQFLQSIYLELSKKRAPARPGAIVRAALENQRYAGLWRDYNGLYDMLLESFAPEEITFFDYATSCRREGGILGVMLDHVGAGAAAPALKQVNAGASNVSPIPLASWGANLLAEPKPAKPWMVNLTTAALADIYRPKVNTCLFSTAELKQLAENFGPRNARLDERLAAQQPGFKLTDPGQEGIEVFRQQIDSRFWIHCARSLAAEKM